ncbi:MAG: hypothetical protein JXR46_00975 [Calditrichaceae bacterium]|nr:hypothetical protein [Calditrichaceae bacterium]MBN2707588.1 hypothetical protein [Calditrichaceae bacterium]RQV97777.1 MAG: hypothetical protein EH224_00265 [Calditrichota bacterium]
MYIFRSLIVFFIIVFFDITIEKLNAQDVINPESGKIYFGINKEPDSLFIDSSKVSLSTKNIVEISPGFYKVKAYLSCYQNIEQIVEVKNRRVSPVRLKFKHLTTNEYNIFKRIRVQNYLTSGILIGISPFQKNGIVLLLPIGLIGLTGQFIWQSKQSSYFNHCNREYTNPNLKSSQNNLFFGINSRIGSEIGFENRDSYVKTVITPSTPVRIERYLKQVIIIAPNDDPLSSAGFTFGFQRKLKQNFHFTIYTNIYPCLIIREIIYDENNINADFDNPRKITDLKNSLFIFGADINYKLADHQNFILYFSLGGMISNTITAKIEQEVIHLSLHYFDENPPLVFHDYSYSVSGVSASIKSKYAFTDRISFNMFFKLYFNQIMHFDIVNNKKPLATAGVNFIYNF